MPISSSPIGGTTDSFLSALERRGWHANHPSTSPTKPLIQINSTSATTMFSDRLDMTDTDVILHSADGQEFRAHKSTLSIASPVFNNMFTFPQPPSSEPSSLPVVDMCETGNILDEFLRCLYPVPKLVVKDFEVLEALVAAAKGYETQVVIQLVGLWLVIPETLKEDPVRVYAIACTSEDLWYQESVATKCTMYNMVADSPPEDLSCLTPVALHNLFVYLVQRDKEARGIIQEPLSLMPWDPRCICGAETRTHLKGEIGQALLAAFLFDPSLSVERAIGLAYKQLMKVHPCQYWRDCVLGTQGEEYAKELMGKLTDMSDELWPCS